MSALRVKEGIGGWWVSRGPYEPVSKNMHATREEAEREMAEVLNADHEAMLDWSRRFARLLERKP